MKSKSTALVAIVMVASAAEAQQKIPVRDLAAPLATSSENFGNIFGVRQLPNDRLLLNDAVTHRVMMLDANLKVSGVVIDSTTGAANSYGKNPAPIIPFLGDSTLFVDNMSQSLLVIDPNGKVTRVMAAPNPQDIVSLSGGNTYVDNRGRLIYRGFGINRALPATRAAAANAAGQPQIPVLPDSNPILRADFETRQTDTIGRVKSQSGARAVMTRDDQGNMVAKRTVNPLPQVDEWGVTSDGSVAFLRGNDYHIDWLNPDDSHSSTGKMPFDWRRLTDEDKQKIVDSAKVAQDEQEKRMADAMKNAVNGGGSSTSVSDKGVTEMRVVVGGAMGGGGGGGGGGMPMQMTMPKMVTEYTPLNEMPDYYPPIRQGAVRPDMDGNLWVLPTTSAQSQNGELVYDMINKKGEVTQRVRLPKDRSIAGFGKGGIVYLQYRDSDSKWHLEKTRIIDNGKATTQD